MDDLPLLNYLEKKPSVQNAKQGQETNRIKFLVRDTTYIFSLNTFPAVYGRYVLVVYHDT